MAQLTKRGYDDLKLLQTLVAIGKYGYWSNLIRDKLLWLIIALTRIFETNSVARE
jgi:hypothetical protein